MTALRKENYMSVFDTLEFAEKAEKVGFTKEQAAFQAKEIAKIIDENLATKKDLKETELKIMAKLEEVERKLCVRLEGLESRLIIKMGSMLVVAVGVLTTLLKLLGGA